MATSGRLCVCEFFGSVVPGGDASSTPAQTRTRVYLARPLNREEVVLTDVGEAGEIVGRIGNQRTPGLDGFKAQVVKQVFTRKTEIVVELYNFCLSRGYLPRKWKVEELRLLFMNPFRDPVVQTHHPPAGAVGGESPASYLQGAVEP